jgi:hypothetical protein
VCLRQREEGEEVLRRGMIRTAVAALALGVLAPGARAQVFGSPVNVSRSASGSYSPSLTIARSGPEAGTLHLFWHDFTSVPSKIWCSDTSTGSFSAGGECVPNVTASFAPRAATDSMGITHLVWRDQAGAQNEIFHATWDGLAWSAPENLSRTAGNSRDPVIAIDPRDRPHVLWQEDPGGGYRFYETHFDGSSWSAAADTGLPFVNPVTDDIRIACDGAGVLHAAWYDGSPSEVFHAERPDGGAWSVPENVSQTPGSGSDQPAIACGPDDTVHVAWAEQDPLVGSIYELCYSKKPAGSSWTACRNISQARSSVTRPVIAVGTDGIPRIAYGLGTIGSREIAFLGAPGASAVNVSVSPAVDSANCTLVLDDLDMAWIAWAEGALAGSEILVASQAIPPILLRVTKDESAGSVLLAWTGGLAPFHVRRAGAPDAAPPWTEISSGGGITVPSFIDAGVLHDRRAWFYLID